MNLHAITKHNLVKVNINLITSDYFDVIMRDNQHSLLNLQPNYHISHYYDKKTKVSLQICILIFGIYYWVHIGLAFSGGAT